MRISIAGKVGQSETLRAKLTAEKIRRVLAAMPKQMDLICLSEAIEKSNIPKQKKKKK